MNSTAQHSIAQSLRYLLVALLLGMLSARIATAASIESDAVIADGGSATAPTYTFNSNQDTGIYSPSANALAFTTAGSQRVSINSNGYVGIGVSNAAANIIIDATSLLEIGGGSKPTFVLQSTATNQESSIDTNGSGLYFDVAGHATATNNNLIFRTGDIDGSFWLAERMRIDSRGRVGIGTNAPASPLHVKTFTDVFGVTAGHFLVKPSGSTSCRLAAFHPTAPSSLTFEAYSYRFLNPSEADLVSIGADGKVGIGTITPEEKLHVNGAIILNAVTDIYTNGNPDNAGIYANGSGSNTVLKAFDGDQNVTVISPHHFELYQPAAEDVLPWTYHSENRLIGKKINVDLSRAIRDLESLTGQQYIHSADLPTSQVLDYLEWQTSQTLRLTAKAKQQLIEDDPWIEIEPEDAIEAVAELVEQTVVVTENEYQLNLDSAEVQLVAVEKEVVQQVPTGNTVKRLKENCRFDKATGKCYRLKTPDDVQLDQAALDDIAAAIVLPQYILDRLPAAVQE